MFESTENSGNGIESCRMNGKRKKNMEWILASLYSDSDSFLDSVPTFFSSLASHCISAFFPSFNPSFYLLPPEYFSLSLWIFLSILYQWHKPLGFYLLHYFFLSLSLGDVTQTDGRLNCLPHPSYFFSLSSSNLSLFNNSPKGIGTIYQKQLFSLDWILLSISLLNNPFPFLSMEGRREEVFILSFLLFYALSSVPLSIQNSVVTW